MPRPRELRDDSFDREVLQSRVPVLVSFWASWCTPCRSTAETAQVIADEFGDRILVTRVNTDASPKTTAAHSTDHLPAYLLFRQGTPVIAIPAHLPPAAISAQIRAALSDAGCGRYDNSEATIERPRG